MAYGNVTLSHPDVALTVAEKNGYNKEQNVR